MTYNIICDTMEMDMSAFDKAYSKFCRKPIPNDITFEEVETIAKRFGCIIDSGGKHSKKIIHIKTGTVIPIPMHGKCVKEAYIKQLKQLFQRIEQEECNHEV